MPFVSFVLPAYKGRFLREAIANILAQTHADFELVVVDDASPDAIKEIVDGFDDPRVSYHRNDRNIGGGDLVGAWQKALSYARGEWCVLASDDDLYEPQFLERMVALAAKYPRVDLVHSRTKIIDGNGKIIGLSPAKRELESAIGMMYDRTVGRADQFAPEFMFRLARLKEIGGFVRFPKAWYSDDATWLLMAANGCANCNEPLFSFRYSGVNISTQRVEIFDLVEAGRQYYGWARQYLDNYVCRDAIEAFMLSEARRRLEKRILGLIREQMRETTWRERINVFRHSKIPSAWKIECMKTVAKKVLLGR